MGEHEYLSTACLHERHEYCNAMVGYQGRKRPAQCKFCGARCICDCHYDTPHEYGFDGRCVVREHRHG